MDRGKRWFGTIVLVTSLLLIFPGANGATKVQRVKGSVQAASPFIAGDCLSGVHRRLQLVSQGRAQGLIGYDFDVDPRTAGKRFKLELLDGSPEADLHITFYESFGTLTDSSPPGNYSYQEDQPGGEHGRVPKGMTKAVVCLYAGEDATFRYTAVKGSSSKKSSKKKR